MGLLVAAALAGPLVFAAGSIFVVGAELNLFGVCIAAILFLFLSLISGAGLSLVYRWCFSRPAATGAALLCSCGVGVWLLSEPVWISWIGALTRGVPASDRMVEGLVYAFVETALFVALVCAVVMAGALLVELPFRLLAPQQRLLDEGIFRGLRWIGSVVVVVVGSAAICDEGLVRLGAVLKRLMV
jgi:hypothetical protein